MPKVSTSALCPMLCTPHLDTDAGKELVKQIRQLRRKPKDGTRRKTFEEIAEILNSREATSKAGKKFTGKIISNIIYRTE